MQPPFGVIFIPHGQGSTFYIDTRICFPPCFTALYFECKIITSNIISYEYHKISSDPFLNVYETIRTALTFPENIVSRPPIFGPANGASSHYCSQYATNQHEGANANSDFRTRVHENSSQVSEIKAMHNHAISARRSNQLYSSREVLRDLR